MQKEKLVIGRREFVSFPNIGIESIEAKIDTGAYSSALHCSRIWLDESKKELNFILLDEDHPEFNERPITSLDYETTLVKSSFGQSEERYKVRLKVRIGTKVVKAIFTLTDRSEMKYPVLLGRRILKNRFIVDVDKKYILST